MLGRKGHQILWYMIVCISCADQITRSEQLLSTLEKNEYMSYLSHYIVQGNSLTLPYKVMFVLNQTVLTNFTEPLLSGGACPSTSLYLQVMGAY